MTEQPNKKTASPVKVFATLLCCALLGAGVGYGSSYLAKPKWTVETQIEKPTVAELGNYYSLFSMYHLVNNAKPELAANDVVYQEFYRLLSSYDFISRFWQQIDYYKQQTTDDPQHDSALLDEFVKALQIEPLNNGSERIRLELDNPKRAYEILNNLMNYANQAAKNAAYEDLKVKWKTTFQQIKAATQANLASTDNQSWQAKLDLMRSVQPLDDHMVAFHYIKQPSQAVMTSLNYLNWAGIGAGAGAGIGLILALFILLRRKSA